MSALPTKQADILLHTLGLDERHPDAWRNHYVTGDNDADINALVAAGLMEKTRTPGFLAPEDRNYRVTDAGRVVAAVERRRRHPPKKRTRYDQWLDRDCAETFGEFLRQRMYRPC